MDVSLIGEVAGDMFTYNNAWRRWVDPALFLGPEQKFTDLFS